MRKIWFITEGILINDGDFITTEIEREFEISPDMFEMILYATNHQLHEEGNFNVKRKHSLKTINKMKRKAISPKKRWEIMQRDGFKCVCCGRGVNDVDCLQVDHIVPVSKGGVNNQDNLQTLCLNCNLGKGVQNQFKTLNGEKGKEKMINNLKNTMEEKKTWKNKTS